MSRYCQLPSRLCLMLSSGGLFGHRLHSIWLAPPIQNYSVRRPHYAPPVCGRFNDHAALQVTGKLNTSETPIYNSTVSKEFQDCLAFRANKVVSLTTIHNITQSMQDATALMQDIFSLYTVSMLPWDSSPITPTKTPLHTTNMFNTKALTSPQAKQCALLHKLHTPSQLTTNFLIPNKYCPVNPNQTSVTNLSTFLPPKIKSYLDGKAEGNSIPTVELTTRPATCNCSFHPREGHTIFPIQLNLNKAYNAGID